MIPKVTVFPEGLSMVGGQDQQGVVKESPLAESINEPPQLMIQIAELCVIELLQA